MTQEDGSGPGRNWHALLLLNCPPPVPDLSPSPSPPTHSFPAELYLLWQVFGYLWEATLASPPAVCTSRGGALLLCNCCKAASTWHRLYVSQCRIRPCWAALRTDSSFKSFLFECLRMKFPSNLDPEKKAELQCLCLNRCTCVFTVFIMSYLLFYT